MHNILFFYYLPLFRLMAVFFFFFLSIVDKPLSDFESESESVSGIRPTKKI